MGTSPGGGRVGITERVDHAGRMVFSRAEGPISVPEILAHLERERAGGGLPYAELIDARGYYPNFTGADVRLIVLRLREAAQRTRLGPTAVLVDTDVGYGMVRVVEMLVEDVAAVRVFRELEPAVAWLRDPGA